MSAFPWSVQNALDNRISLGKDAVSTYWQHMTPKQKNSVDLWIMRSRPAIFTRCAQGTQSWRFETLIEVLYDNYCKNTD